MKIRPREPLVARVVPGWEASMAYRNLVRSCLAASVLALTAAAPLLGPPAQAAAADNQPITVTVRDDGFSQTAIDARAGDILVFRLDDAAMNKHTLAWDQGQIRFTFDRSRPNGTYRQYGPLNAGTLHFYDAEEVPGYNAGGPFTGILTVSNPPPSSSSTSSTSTTVTAPPSTDTTTTTAPTTTTSAPSPVRPFLIPDPGPTTTTTAVHNPVTVGAGPTKNGGTPAPTANKDNKEKDKNKSGAAGTSTTTAPAPTAAPPDSVFDPNVLTPGPTTLPEPASAGASGDEEALNAASVLDLIDPEKPVADDGNTRLLLIAAVAAFTLLVLAAGTWCWLHRASAYDPA